MDQQVEIAEAQAISKPYDKRRLSYSGTFTNPFKVGTIRTLEWVTAKTHLLRLIRKFEKRGAPMGAEFWPQALDVMGIEVTTPPEQIARIPKEGPLVVVANHPHGLVDGMVLAYLIGQVRDDYLILTRSLLTGIPEIEQYMLPVPFPHEENARENSLKMRAACMAQLKRGGVVVLFPAGQVAYSETLFGPVIEREWNPFTAKMLARSGASVLPIRFPGQNSRAYQVANKLSATVRQGLLLYEIKRALYKPQHPVIGHPKAAEDIAEHLGNPRKFLADLRAETLSL
ncbi:lysophospholipid acyltransferase family protein [Thioclava atlantica]|uniref:Acyltransferase domain-containing protein n=1 Tax=Thioclava atlantica TaxID=1317124 RepID=A0A085TTE4_9RHOB|nr:lysophospholipid acyltransferase family protein [Thioclava atlantica]KFE33991.1 acyltransferase domain-containing protein [Thioclava atlantica]